MARTKTQTALALALALTVIMPTPAYPHGGGVLRVASKQVASGGTISMTGEKFVKNESLRAELRGVLDNYPLGSVKIDGAGLLKAELTIPPAVRPGAYTLVLIAADGDVAARMDMSVGSPAAAGAAASGMPHMAGGTMAGMPGMGEASAGMMEIDLNTTTAEWIVIAALIFASFVGGAVLLSRSRRLAVRY